MSAFFLSVFAQAIPFLLLAYGISLSYHVLRATDMTIDGSFVLGAAIFARLVTLSISPYIAFAAALFGGFLAGGLTATVQRGGRVDPLLAGVLVTFMLGSLNLIIMAKPNISLLSQPTLLSYASSINEQYGLLLILGYTLLLCTFTYVLLRLPLGLSLRAFGDNPSLLKRLGKSIECYRVLGFGISNMLAAAAGCLTAQTIGYADISMGLGMTLTGIGAIVMGQQLLQRFSKRRYFRSKDEFLACLIGVLLYFFALNFLLRLDIDPIYLKMLLGALLIFFLRAAIQQKNAGRAI